MSEDTVTYSELKLPQVKEARPGKRHPTSKKRKTLCKIIVGIICFLVIVKIAGIAYASFQNSRNTKKQDKNATSPGPEDDSVVPADTGRVSGFLVIQHHCHRRHCYYLSNQEVTWKESEKSCQDMNSKLLTIDDKEEQTFIQSKIKYTYWIGFCISEDKHKWKWQDGTEPAEQLVFQHITKMDGKCGCIKPRFIDSADCTRKFPYICEKNETFNINSTIMESSVEIPQEIKI